MQAAELLLSGPKPPRQSGKSPASSWPKPHAAEQFDAVMGRALARSLPGTREDSAPPDEKPRSKDEPMRAQSADLSGVGLAEASACAERPAPQIPQPAQTNSSRDDAADSLTIQTAVSAALASSAGQTDSISSTASTIPAGPIVPPSYSGAGAALVAPPTASSAGAVANPLPVNDAVDGKAGVEKEIQALAGKVRPNPPPPPATGQALAAPAESQPASEVENAAATGDPPTSPALLSEVPDLNGISAAKQHGGMKKAEETNKVAALAEQNLPVAPATTAAQAQPVRIKFIPRPEGSDLAATHGSATPGSAASPEAAGTTVAVASSADGFSASPVRSLERTQDLMALQTQRLRDSGADSLQVVIKPGPGLHLSLNLQMRDGNVEMSATLNRGDYDLLNRHWADLQQQMEARGVRLAPLTCGDQSGWGDSRFFQQSDRHPSGDNAAAGEAFVDFALLGAMKPAPTIKTPVQRGWESWA